MLTGTARRTDMGTEAQQKGVKQMEDKYFVFGVIRYTGETIHVDKENAYTGGESNIELQHVKVDIESERVESMIQRDIKAGRPDPTIEIIAENLTEDEADELVLDKRALTWAIAKLRNNKKESTSMNDKPQLKKVLQKPKAQHKRLLAAESKRLSAQK